MTSSRCRNGVARDDQRRHRSATPSGGTPDRPRNRKICLSRPPMRRKIVGPCCRLFPSDRRPSQMTPGAPPLGGFCAPREREHEPLRSTHPSPGRRTLIAAASVSLALASLATTVATADAETGARQPHRRHRRPTGRRSQDLLRRLRHADPEEAGRGASRRARRHALRARSGPRARSSRCPRARPSTSSLEETDKIFVVLVEFGDDAVPDGDRKRSTARRRTAAPPTSPARCTTRSREPNRSDRQQHAVAGRLQPRPTTRTCTSTG